MNIRIQKLLKTHRNLEHTNYRESKDLTVLQNGQSDLESVIIRKAKALALLLDETQTVIQQNELIVGLRTIYGSLETGQNVYGSYDFELPVQPATNHCLRYFPHYLTNLEREELHSVGLSEGYAIAHIPFGGQQVLASGYGGLQDKARQRLKDLTEASETPDTSSKIAFLQAIIIVFEAATRFVLKHGMEAERLVHTAPDAQRQEELRRIAATCRWIAISHLATSMKRFNSSGSLVSFIKWKSNPVCLSDVLIKIYTLFTFMILKMSALPQMLL